MSLSPLAYKEVDLMGAKEDLEALLKGLSTENFTGESDYYVRFPHPGCHLQMEYSLANMVMDHQASTTHVVTHLDYANTFRVTSMREVVDGKSKSLSQQEIADLYRYNIMEGRYLHNDPRYVMHIATDIQKTGPDVYDVRVWEMSFPKTEIRAELHFQNGLIEKMILRKLMGKKKKELKKQRTEITFKPVP